MFPIRISFFLLFVFVSAGCQSTAPIQDGLIVGQGKKIAAAVDGSRKVPLISGVYQTAADERLVIPFTANNLSRAPELRLSFVVKSRGHCLFTYEDTEIRLNGGLLKSLDFRQYEDEQTVDLDITLPLNKIRAGDNQLLIAMGACDFDIDSLQLNQTTLSF